MNRSVSKQRPAAQAAGSALECPAPAPDAAQTVLAIGATPPPLGGVTVFFERWVARARSAGATVHLLDPRHARRNPLGTIWRLLRRCDRVVLNSVQPLPTLIAKAVHPFTPLTIIDHNASRNFKLDPWWKKRIRRMSVRLADEIWLVSGHLRVHYAGHGARVREIGTFLPPDSRNAEGILASYDAKTLRLVEGGKGPGLLIAAWRPVEEEGADLYGLADSVLLLRRLRAHHPDARLIVFIGEAVSNPVWERFSALVREPDVAEAIAVETGQKELWPLLPMVDVMLRLTATDGNSVSIHEAHWAGCAVVASDVVPRPAWVRTYEYGSMDDLEQTVVNAWRSRDKRQ